jgi:diacylglycerol kinase (ATP)
MRMDIELIINTADPEERRRLREWTSRLRSAGHQVQARLTFEAEDATRFAREAAARTADLVISGGGDGTLNGVVNGILPPVGAHLPERIPRLAIVPLGTGNDFAGFIGVPPDIDEAFAFALEAPEIRADVAVLNGRYYANVSSGGLGAEATEETPDRAKRLLGSVAYLVTGVRTFAALDPSHGRFVSDGEVVFDGPFLFFAVGNGGRAGGGNRITPRADLTDGLLDLCVVGAMSRTELLRILPEIRTGDHLDSEHVTYRRLARLVVEPSGKLCVNADGEPIEAMVLDYSVVPGALRLAGRTG